MEHWVELIGLHDKEVNKKTAYLQSKTKVTVIVKQL